MAAPEVDLDKIFDQGIILATASYDHTIRFWHPATGACLRTVQHPESQVSEEACQKTRDTSAAKIESLLHISSGKNG